ncbi:MAG: hypothetical protein ACR2LK_11690 [Solirubrobacteraceae bacterium]
MSVRSKDGVGSSIERLLAGLSGPPLVDDPPPQDRESHEAPSDGGADQGTGDAEQNDRYDEDFDYYWAGVRLPLWIALIWQVPWRQRLDIFVIGFIIGMVVAGAALLWGFVLSQY